MEIKDGRYFIPTTPCTTLTKWLLRLKPTDHIENLFKTLTVAGSSSKGDI